MPVKGALEFEKFKQGKPLTRKQALLAQCYECNGYENEDCLGVSCPLYQWSPYNKNVKFKLQDKQKPYPKALIESNIRRRKQIKDDSMNPSLAGLRLHTRQEPTGCSMASVKKGDTGGDVKAH